MLPASRESLVQQLHRLGVRKGGVLLVHTSFRAVRPVEGGPLGLTAALRDAVGPEGTVVMPSWTDDDDHVFDPHTSEAPADLGIVAQLFWRQPDVVRSGHPHAFAAAGSQAAFVLQDGLQLPPHVPESPVGRVHELDGQVLLLGVHHDANTTVHLAELIAGVRYRRPKHCTVLVEGQPTRIDYGENDHCCDRFRLVDDWVRDAGVQTEGIVGAAQARLVGARDLVAQVTMRLENEPLLFLHNLHVGCRQCDEARMSIGKPR